MFTLVKSFELSENYAVYGAQCTSFYTPRLVLKIITCKYYSVANNVFDINRETLIMHSAVSAIFTDAMKCL